MYKKKSPIKFSIAIAAACLAMAIVQPHGLVNKAEAQSQEKGGQGFMKLDPAADRSDPTTVYSNAYDTLSKSIVEERIKRGEPGFAGLKINLSGGLDYVASGVATRNSGNGWIRLRGVPAGATPVSAVLYYGSMSTTANPAVCFNGQALAGVNFGTAQEPCWNSAATFFAYIASVPLGAIVPGINGDYRISCLPSSVTDGSAPSTNALPLSEGATLVVIYSHPSVPPTAQIFINHGPQLFISGMLNTVNFAVIGPHTTLKSTRIGADGQVGGNNSSSLNVTDEATSIGPGFAFTNPPLVQIKGPGSVFNGDSDWNGGDGEPLNRLWDTHTDVLPGNLIPAGNIFHTVQYISHGDCVVWVAHILGAQ
jgi:hypothetical protein